MNLAVNNNSNFSVASNPAFSATESGGTKGAQTRDQAVDKLVDMFKNGQISKDSPLAQMINDKLSENMKGVGVADLDKALKQAVSDVLKDKVPDLGGKLPQAGGPDMLQQALDGLNKASVQDFVKTGDDGGAEIKGSQAQGQAIGQYMDQHPEMYPKPDVGDGEKVTSWEDELSKSDKTLNSDENASVQAAIKDIVGQMDNPGANQPSGVNGQGSNSGSLGDPVGQNGPQNQGNNGLLGNLGDIEQLLQLLTGQGQGQGQNVSGNQPASNAGESGNSQGAGGAGGALQQLQDLVQQLLALLTGQGGQTDQTGQNSQNNQNNQNSQNSQSGLV